MRLTAMYVGILSIGAISCCIDSVKLTPTAEALSVKEKKIGKASVQAQVDLRPCCPMSKEHRKTVNSIETEISKLAHQAASGELPLADYEQRLNAAQAGLIAVRKTCERAPVTPPVVSAINKATERWFSLAEITDDPRDADVTFRDRSSAIDFLLRRTLDDLRQPMR